ncbi:MAG TPA: carboxypeptidase regulatory-like domain-containing protein, partial [Longimicrobiaceae bacterium]|nr:carboxypeptidase regulatory-like domain-containing protein [Longimicrobiaceae bacterium]
MATCRAWRWILAAGFVLLAAQPAAAQAIRATARDAASGAPVAEAMVRVHAADGTLAAAGFTGLDGVVVLRVRQPGTYAVQVRRAGYHAAEVGDVAVTDGAAAVEIRMAQRPFSLDTVVVMGQRPDERGRHGFERRRLTGDGVFLDSAYLAQRSGAAGFAADLLRGVPGVYIVSQGINERMPRSERGWKCMVLLLDGRPVELVFRDGGRRDLHHIIGPRDVKSVEVYREFSEVPPEFRPYAQQGMFNCGVFLYWT